MSSPSKRWNSRSLGSRFAHNIFYTAIRLGGRWPAYIMLYFVVAFYTCLPRVRERSAAYRHLRLGPRGPLQSWVDCYTLHMNFARTLVDRAVLGIRGEFWLEAREGHSQLLQALMARGRGVVVLTAHVGCWQLSMSSLEHIDAPKAVVMLRDHADVDRQYFEHGQNCGPGFSVIDPRGPLGGVLEMLEALRQGALLCMMGDREFGSENSLVDVTLLGRSASMPASAYHLASAAQAPLAIIFTRRTGPGRGQVWVEEVIEVPAGLGRNSSAYAPFAQRFADALTSYTNFYPFQFYNFFDLWTEQR